MASVPHRSAAVRPGPALLVVLAAGLLTAVVGAWQVGLLLVGVTLVLAAVLRVCLEERLMVPLAVRTRWLDVLFLLVAAVALIAPALALG